MAIAIEGLTVVVRLDRAAALLPGGIDDLQAEGNRSAGQDEHLWRCCFMADVDGEGFFERLRQKGLNATPGPDPDMVLVNEFEPEVVPYCEWLLVRRAGKAVIAWFQGTTPKTVIATPGWSFETGSGLQRVSETDQKLKFLRVDHGGVEVYFNEASQQEVFVAREQPSAEAIDWRFKSAASQIQSRWVNPGEPIVVGNQGEAIRAAIAELEAVSADAPDAWQPYFMVGKGWQALGDLQKAYASLRRAYELAGDVECVPREFAGVCLELGLGDEAVTIGERAASLIPDSHETLGNLACAFIIAGRHAEAERTIQAAIKLRPDDRINLHLKCTLDDIATRRRPQPRCLKDLMTVPKPSLWNRLRLWWS